MKTLWSWVGCLVLAVLPACGTPARKCADTCAGCCDLNGVCRSIPSVDFCGLGGASCRACAQNQQCQTGLCSLIISGVGGGSSAGGGSAGGSTAGGVTAGGSTAGGTSGGDAGGATSGGTSGGSVAGGAAGGSSGGATAGGSSGGTSGGASGGSTAGGSSGGASGGSSGGSTAGGSSGGTSGGSSGGATAGGASGGTAGGSSGGATAGGSSGGTATCSPACPPGRRCLNGLCVCDSVSCPTGCCSAAGICIVQSPSSCNTNGGACISCGQTANACVNGVCMCGASSSCGSGQRCVGGSCVCDAVSCNNGCCAGGTCRTRTASNCGAAGAACVACGVESDTCSSSGACTCGANPACQSPQVCSAGSCVAPGSDWIQRTTVPMPNPVYAASVAYDFARSRLIVFGGRFATGSMLRSSETWELGPSGWTQRTPMNVPPARSGHDMAYDPVRQRIVMFGGFPDNGVRLGDTWLWDGSNWLAQTPSAAPTARSGHRMTWDATNMNVVLFGGRLDGSGATYVGDTWTWNGSTWTPAATVGLSAREGVALAFDPGFLSGNVILHGGIGSSGNRSDTYAWNGTAWTLLTLTTSVPGRVFHDMTYSPALGKILLFGGSSGGSAGATFYGDTWVFDRSTWTQLTPANPPMPRNGHVLEVDPTRGKVQCIGGWNGTTVFATPMEY